MRISNNLFTNAGNFFEKFGRVNDIYNENIQLREQNVKLESEISALKEAKVENEMLKQLLQFDRQKEFKVITSNIIGKNTDNIGCYIIIDKGANDGVSQDDAVIVGNGILVGKITEAAAEFSKVKLTTSADSAIAVIIQESRAKGIARGQYNLSIMLDMINPTETVEIGNRVVTSGQDNEFPKGLLIGAISQVNTVSGYIFKTASITPVLNFDKLESVFVLSKKQE